MLLGAHHQPVIGVYCWEHKLESPQIQRRIPHMNLKCIASEAVAWNSMRCWCYTSDKSRCTWQCMLAMQVLAGRRPQQGLVISGRIGDKVPVLLQPAAALDCAVLCCVVQVLQLNCKLVPFPVAHPPSCVPYQYPYVRANTLSPFLNCKARASAVSHDWFIQ